MLKKINRKESRAAVSLKRGSEGIPNSDNKSEVRGPGRNHDVYFPSNDISIHLISRPAGINDKLVII